MKHGDLTRLNMVNYEQRSMISYPSVIKRGSLESPLFSSMIFPASRTSIRVQGFSIAMLPKGECVMVKYDQ